jgi:hypothetical protein
VERAEGEVGIVDADRFRGCKAPGGMLKNLSKANKILLVKLLKETLFNETYE